MFEFKKDLNSLDEKSIFANRICKLVYQKHDGNLDYSIRELAPYFQDLKTFVRNIYELIGSEIPLFAYYQLIKFGANNWDFTELEYTEVLNRTIEACHYYYK